jgi:hypothetical protein
MPVSEWNNSGFASCIGICVNKSVRLFVCEVQLHQNGIQQHIAVLRARRKRGREATAGASGPKELLGQEQQEHCESAG